MRTMLGIRRPNLKTAYRFYQHIQSCESALELYKLVCHKRFIPIGGFEYQSYNHGFGYLRFDSKNGEFKFCDFNNDHLKSNVLSLYEAKAIYTDFVLHWYFGTKDKNGELEISSRSLQTLKKLSEIYD